MITKGVEYTLLEVRFVDTTFKGMIMESRAQTITFKLKEAEVMAWEAEEKAEAVEAEEKAEAASVGVQAVKEYKKSMAFEDEVGEAAFDAYQKGFVEGKRMVMEDFRELNLISIMAIELEQQEEVEDEEVETKVIEEVTEPGAPRKQSQDH